MPGETGELLPGIGDYNEFRHRLKDEEEAEEIGKRHKQEKVVFYQEDVDDEDELEEDQDNS